MEAGNLGPTYNIVQAHTNNGRHSISRSSAPVDTDMGECTQSESRAVTYPQRTDVVVMVRSLQHTTKLSSSRYRYTQSESRAVRTDVVVIVRGTPLSYSPSVP